MYFIVIIYKQSYIILNQTIYKNKNTQDIYNKTTPGPDTVKGGACAQLY